MPDMTATKLPMTQAEYQERVQSPAYIALCQRVQQDPRRFQYHIQPPTGWLNDPNGLCQKDGVYHIYHQYVPFYPERCNVVWGHVTTTDFIHYDYHEPALFPDTAWDANGPYSGSALLRDGTIYLYYTGNVRYVHPECDYDYIHSGREQNTILTTSPDGFQFSTKHLLMKNVDYPADLTLHVRDPQVFSENGRYCMIQGARDQDNRGCALLFESADGWDWKYKLRFQATPPFGYMWECPNYVKVDGKAFLIACPQGIPVEATALHFNSNQCGWFSLDYDFVGEAYTLGAFQPLDYGFDFYAPQAFRDATGRCILLGWMATPDADYEGETTLNCGWTHALTIPRQLLVNEQGRLCQKPLDELKEMRQAGQTMAFVGTFETETPACFEVELQMEQPQADFTLSLRESATLQYANGVLSLDMTPCGAGRTVHAVPVPAVRHLDVWSDSSSLEIFVNDGEWVFTTRVFDSMQNLRIALRSDHAQGTIAHYMLMV